MLDAPDYLGANQNVSVDLVLGSLLARPDVRGEVNALAFLVMASVAMILLIACANVASLSLARSAVRQREIGVRLSVAESNGRVGASETSVGYWVVSPDYFPTLSIPIVRERNFGVRDAGQGPPVAIINEAMARQFWPGQDPVGKRLRPGPASVPFTEVVGVVKNTRGAGGQYGFDRTALVDGGTF